MGTSVGAAEVVLLCYVDAQATGKMSSLATAISKGSANITIYYRNLTTDTCWCACEITIYYRNLTATVLVLDFPHLRDHCT
jgi:hypothetical protein